VKKFRGLESISITQAAPISSSPPPLFVTGFPFPLPLRKHGRNGNIGVEKGIRPGKKSPGSV